MSTKVPARHAAQYVRMSTDHQRYSIDNQIDAIREYAAARGYTLVKTYSDPGRSGLRLKNRPGLQRLLADVESGGANYRTIIVYDVSRWGRFQDTDESAYYEHLCRRSGVSVTYCAEPFDSYDGALVGIVKNLKRYMAAEFSRDLSRKTFHGQARVSGMGFRTGGPPGLGYRRLVIGENGEPKQLLRPGEYKALKTDRIVLTPGPEREIALIREIFESFLNGRTCYQIAKDLNARGHPSYYGRIWRGGTIRHLILNPRYVGDAVYARSSKKLGAPITYNPPDQWVRAHGWQGIIERDTFDRAQRMMRARSRLTDDELLARLRNLLAREGRLTPALMDADPDLPSCYQVARRFGSYRQAYTAAGYTGGIARNLIEPLPSVSLRKAVRDAILERLREDGHQPKERATRIELYGKRYSVLSVSHDSGPKLPPWTRTLGERRSYADLVVALRLSEDETRFEDIWLLPRNILGSYFSLAPGKRLWNTVERYPDAKSAADALARLIAAPTPRR